MIGNDFASDGLRLSDFGNVTSSRSLLRQCDRYICLVFDSRAICGIDAVPRLTKSDIERALLAGTTLPWTDAAGKTSSIQLGTARQRRLFAYLLGSKVRDVRALPQTFVDGLATAFVAADDPAASNIQQTVNPSASGPWKIQSLKVKGFGGVNLWNGKPLELTLDQESLLIEGPNGSGKSSLNAAIIWGLTGERPRDQGDSSLEREQPVFDPAGRPVGAWPPVAAYPPDLASMTAPPDVSVEIFFSNAVGTQVSAIRRFDGKNVTFKADPALQIPSILLEAGLLMPARLPHLRLSEGKGRLTDAVQKLTGLDELVELGAFIQALCHSSRDYLAYKKAELTAARAEFDKQIERARASLESVAVTVPNFKPSDTADRDGSMAEFGKLLNDKAARSLATVSGDLASDLVLADPKVQQRIVVALDGAGKELNDGLAGLPSWKLVEGIATALSRDTRATVRQAMKEAESALANAVEYFAMQEADSKFRLKAAGALWHSEHGQGPVANCPLCDAQLANKPDVQRELEALREAGEVATRRLDDNLNAILATLAGALPLPIRRSLGNTMPSQPRSVLETEYRNKFVDSERYAKCLVRFHVVAEAAIARMPAKDIGQVTPRAALLPAAATVAQRLDQIDLMCRLAEWYDAHSAEWSTWWEGLAAVDDDSGELSAHLRQLGKAIHEAEPYRIGADAMRLAWAHGKTAAVIETEQQKRLEIAESLAPLKQLGNLAEAQARDTITDLSSRISAIHNATYVVDRLKFQETILDKKAGLVVRGQIGEDIRIDATLIANTSWLRAILWAFIHALREEAVDQIGADVFPVLMLDDPQLTFDLEHRTRWAEQLAKLQKTAAGVQVLLTTHDDQFLSHLGMLGVTGRAAHICSAGDEFGHVAILEGDELQRKWATAVKLKAPDAAKEYVAAVRVFVEGMLRLMLRGIDPSIPTAVVGACREKISQLHAQGIEPWNQPAFSALVAALAYGRKEVTWMEQSHHAGTTLGMTEAVDVEKHWRESLRAKLERCFRIVRDHRALHGGLTALHAFPPTTNLPEGYKAKVREFKLPLLGTASAVTEGRVADGCLDLTFASASSAPTQLKDHLVLRLAAQTLEPVARKGDLILVADHAKVTPLSLVVALHEDRILARRLQVADNHSDVAVLTASSINPRLTAPPIVAKRSTLTMKKIAGVLYEAAKFVSGHSETEVVACGGEAAISAAISRAKGLVEVSGHSAEPLALDKQFLLVSDPLTLKDAAKTHDGQPVIVEDSDGGRYFKRLRMEANHVILESLEIGGEFPPLVLAKTAGLLRHAVTVWPVLGVLFDKP